MPNRILKESICTSDSVDALSSEAENFFYRLIVQCDDFGRFDARPSVLRARCYPLRLDRVTDADISRWLTELVDTKTIIVYHVDGKPYLQFAAWDEHQQVRAKRSKYPPMQADAGNGYQMISDASTCHRNPIQSNPNPSDDMTPLASTTDPNAQAVRNAYDACGLLFSKTHLDAHLETITRTGLLAWQLGFAEAMKTGKHNVPRYVARCAESAMLAEQQRSNGHGKKQPAEQAAEVY